MKVFVLMLLGVAVLLTVYLSFESYRFSQWIRSGHEVIKTQNIPGNRVKTDTLPPLLQKYLQKAILAERPSLYVNLSQSGTFRMKPNDVMSAFEANQVVSIISPMFSWLAKIRMKGLKVVVCDRLINSQGELQARLFSSILLARGAGKSFLRGELLRYLAEIPWFPEAILKQPDIKWQQVAEHKVTATIKLGSVNASVEYTFSEDGMISSIFVADREKADGDKVELLPWLGEFRHYEERSGVVIPTEGEVSWLLDSGKFTYFIGKITNYKVHTNGGL